MGTTFFEMKLLSILAFSTGILAQYNTCTDVARCDYQCSSSLFGLVRESCSGNNADLACCTETEACDLVSAATLTCTDLPYLDGSANARTYTCCGGSDGGDTDGGDSGSSNSTEAAEVTTAVDDSTSGASQIGASMLALFVAKLL